MKITKDQVVLFLAPHTDDADFGAGGTMCKLIEQGNEVYQVAFSTAQNTVEHGTRNPMLMGEIIRATNELGLEREHLFIHEFNTRMFFKDRQEILDLLIYYSKMLKPDVVFVPSSNDIHQDHKVIYDEAVRAFKTKTILGYEAIWNNLTFNCQVFVELTEQQIGRKIYATSMYQSQSFRIANQSEFIKALAITRGTQVKKQYAEVFECIRINM